MPTPPDHHKTIAKLTAAAFGGAPKVIHHHTANNKQTLAVLQSADQPWHGVTSYATVGLSDVPTSRNVTPPLGVELLGVANSDLLQFADVIATAGFFWMNDGWEPEPGACFRDIVRMHVPKTELPHLLLVAPNMWQDAFASQVIDGHTVAWLLAVPVSEAEAAYAQQHGYEALEDFFEQQQTDITNLSRTSVV